MNLSHFLETVKRRLLAGHDAEAIARLVSYLVADWKPHLDHSQRLMTTSAIIRQARKDLGNVPA